jgi:hypothetical protein
MKLISDRELDFPSLGRVVNGEFEATEEEAQIFLMSPYVTIKEKENVSHAKTGSSRNRG